VCCIAVLGNSNRLVNMLPETMRLQVLVVPQPRGQADWHASRYLLGKKPLHSSPEGKACAPCGQTHHQCELEPHAGAYETMRDNASRRISTESRILEREALAIEERLPFFWSQILERGRVQANLLAAQDQRHMWATTWRKHGADRTHLLRGCNHCGTLLGR